MPWSFDVLLDFQPITPDLHWRAELTIGFDKWDGDFLLDYGAHTAALDLHFISLMTACDCWTYNLPIVWGTSTLYAITTWDLVNPLGSLHEAHFTF